MVAGSVSQRNASAEILRMALQHMSRHEASFQPSCYAVWYAYLSGAHPQLKQTMDNWIEAGKPVDDVAIDYFYQTFLAECNLEKMFSLRGEAERILGDISLQTEQARSRAHLYDDHLRQSVSRLDEPQDTEALRGVLSQLQADTRDMRSSVQELRDNLRQSQQEIEALRQELETARHETLIDPLTGTLNRRGFLGELERMIEQEMRLHLIMLDIDRFKHINDNYGHLFGDKVIRAVAEACASLTTDEGAVARLGGEEFAVLMPGAMLEQVHALAERIRTTIEKGAIRRNDSQEAIGGITISIGVTAFRGGEEASAFLDRADRALYTSKQAGRNRTTVTLE